VALTPNEVNAIFDEEHVSDFDDLVQKRVERMTAPSFGRKLQKPEITKGQSKLLPGFDDD